MRASKFTDAQKAFIIKQGQLFAQIAISPFEDETLEIIGAEVCKPI